MRLASSLSLGLHAFLFGVLALSPAGGGTTPPRFGSARIGFACDSVQRVELEELRETLDPIPFEPDLVPAPTVELPLIEMIAAVPATSPPPAGRVPPRRTAPAVLASTMVAPQGVPATLGTGGMSAPPSLLRNPEPRYPSEARRRGWQGTTLLLVRVGLDGSCRDARVVDSSGHPRLDESALDAVRRWTFSPALRDGHPVEAEIEVPVHFVLE